MFRTRTIGVAFIAVGLAIVPSFAAAFDPVVATNNYLSAIDAGTRLRAAAYSDGARALGAMWGALVVVVALALWRTGWMRGLHTAVGAALTLVLIALSTSPLAYYRGFVFEQEFGRSTQSFEFWSRDYLISAGIIIVGGVIAVIAIYALMRRFPMTWWLWSAALVTMAAAAFVVAAPFVNTYEPMERGPLKAHVLSLAQGRGLAVNEVYRFDASRRNERLTAEVTPWIGPVRVAISDTLLDRGSGSEVRAVVARHIGHRILDHALQLLTTFAIVAVVALLVIALVIRWIVRGDGIALGVSGQADPATVPLFVGLVALAGFAAMPVLGAQSRALEADADNFSLNEAREPDALATMALKRAAYAKLDPAPWEDAIFSLRPNARETILRAMLWKAGQLSTVPVPDFEVEVGCSPDRLKAPSADVRWVADGTPLENLRIDVAVTKQGLAAGRFATIVLTEGGGATLVPNSDFSPTALELSVEPPVTQSGALERGGPLLAAVRVNGLAPGVNYFWRVRRAEGAITTTLRTETSSCPTDVEEEE